MKGFNFDDLIKNIIDTTRESSKQTQSKKEKGKQKRIFKTINPQAIDVTPSVQSAFDFIRNIINNSQKLVKQQKKDRQQEQFRINVRKYMMQLTIQPLYFLQDRQATILKFEFQLGTSNFLERIQKMYEQLHCAENCIDNITSNHTLIQFFDILEQHQSRIRELYEKIIKARKHIKHVKQTLQKRKAKENMRKKQIILKKIAYLKSIRDQKSFLQLQCDDIDKVFYSERERVRMYNKLIKAEGSIGRIQCLNKWRQKLIYQGINSINIVQNTLKQWQKVDLDDNIVEKMLIIVHYIQKQPLYLENCLQIDWRLNNMKKLYQRIQIVRSWRRFQFLDYQKNVQKIHKLLSSLQNKCSQ